MASVMLDRGVLVSLMQEIGWKAAEKKVKDEEWTNAKIRAIPKNVAEMEFESEDAKAMAEVICKAIEDDEDVEFELAEAASDESEVLEGTNKKKKKAKAEKSNDVDASDGKKKKKEKGSKPSASTSDGKKKKKEKGSKPSASTSDGKKTKLERDKWGLRVGSLGSMAMAVLGKKPKKMGVIVSEAKLSDTCYDLMKRMVANGVVSRSDDGFCLAHAGK